MIAFRDCLYSAVLIVCGLAAAALLLSWSSLWKGRRTAGLPYPPGPKPLPLLGNILQIDTVQPWLSCTRWERQYGEILYVSLLGLDFIILNSERVARDLLDRRSTIYSDRPLMPTHKLFGMDFNSIMLPYGDEWRLHRKLLHHAMRPDTKTAYYEMYKMKTKDLLINLLDTPHDVERHLKTFTGSIIMSMAYGYDTQPTNDPLVSAVEELIALLSKSLLPEIAAILTAFPYYLHLAAYLPSWFPGANLKKDGIIGQKLAAKVLDVPFNLVKKNLAEGTASPCLVADCLSQIGVDVELPDRERLEHAIKSVAATLFIAGSEASSSLLHAFILAMVLYPDVQAKAQAEVDAVIGTSRLPEFKDWPSLRYVQALLRELLRWNPVVPLGIPHATSSCDVYNGCFIPKGAYVITNVWAMSKDDDKYRDPEDFRPERFMSSTADPVNFSPFTSDPVFGFGRRICPGRFASEAFIFIAVVSILATFNMTKAKDSEGHEIPVERKFTTGISVHPVSFPCAFISRSSDRERVLRTSVRA